MELEESELELFEPILSQSPKKAIVEPSFGFTQDDSPFAQMGASDLTEAHSIVDNPDNKWEMKTWSGPVAFINLEASWMGAFEEDTDQTLNPYIFAGHAVIPSGYTLEAYNNGPVSLGADKDIPFVHYEDGDSPRRYGRFKAGYVVESARDLHATQAESRIEYDDLVELIKKRYCLQERYNVTIRVEV